MTIKLPRTIFDNCFYPKELKEEILKAMRYLVSRTDNEDKLDHAGFSKRDITFGKYLASKNTITDKEADESIVLCKYYQRQLIAAGINVKLILSHPSRSCKRTLLGVKWTPEQNEVLKDLYNKGLNLKQISLNLSNRFGINRTEKACECRIRILTNPLVDKSGNIEWNLKDDNKLIELYKIYGSDNLRKLTYKFNKGNKTIRKVAGVEKRLQFLIKNKVISVSSVTTNKESSYKKTQEYNAQDLLNEKRHIGYAWYPEHDKYIKTLYNQNKSFDEISEFTTKKFSILRTPRACKDRLYELIGERYIWSEGEDEFLFELYHIHGSDVKEILVQFNKRFGRRLKGKTIKLHLKRLIRQRNYIKNIKDKASVSSEVQVPNNQQHVQTAPTKTEEDIKYNVRGMITRSTVASILKVSLSTVRRLEDDGSLNPVIVNQVHYFSKEDVEKIKYSNRITVPGVGRPRRNSICVNQTPEGLLASLAFSEFENGVPLTKVVINLQITPDVAVDLYKKWKELKYIK